MSYLILGLMIFLGAHSVRIVADDWRTRTRSRIGELAWRGLFSATSMIGLSLLIWGFGLSREQPVQLWNPPLAMRHTALLLTLLSFVFISATYVPNNAIKGRLHHPLVLAVLLWSAAHLMANGNLAHTVLFGSFLLWSILSFTAARRRDRVARTAYPGGQTGSTALAILLGLCGWGIFNYWLHGLLIGVRPLG